MLASDCSDRSVLKKAMGRKRTKPGLGQKSFFPERMSNGVMMRVVPNTGIQIRANIASIEEDEAARIQEILSRSEIRLIDGEVALRDLEIGEIFGFSWRYDVRQLIHRNLKQLEQSGNIWQIPNIQNGAGKPGMEYWLTQGPIYRLCLLSRTPKILERHVLLASILEAHQGKTDLQEKRRHQIELAQLIPMLQAMKSELLSAIGSEKTEMLSQIRIVNTNVLLLRKELNEQSKHQRFEFKEGTKADLRWATLKVLDGKCLFCPIEPKNLVVDLESELIQVFNSNGEQIEGGQYDHYHGAARREFTDGCIPCVGCHKARTNKELSDDYCQSCFENFQKKAAILFASMTQKKLFA